MNVDRTTLPEYAHPPLLEAALGVVFASPIDPTPSRLTEFQQRLGPEWLGDWSDVAAEAREPVPDAGLLAAGAQLTNVLGDRLIRIGTRHFAFIWLGIADTRYPRYENVRDGFVAAWDRWVDMRPESARCVARWVVSYLNRIPQGTVWQTAADWSFFKLLPGPAAELTQPITRANWQLRDPAASNELTIDWTADGAEDASAPTTVWLRLTASGAVSRGASGLLDGMDAGRAAIVRTFSNLMSPAANAYWGLRRREK